MWAGANMVFETRVPRMMRLKLGYTLSVKDPFACCR